MFNFSQCSQLKNRQERVRCGSVVMLTRFLHEYQFTDHCSVVCVMVL